MSPKPAGQMVRTSPPTTPAGRSDLLLGVLVEALPVGVLVQDADRRVVLVNSAFTRLVGISARPDELLGVVFDGTAQHVRDLLGGPAGRTVPAGGPTDQAEPDGLPGEVRTAAGRVLEREHLPLTAAGQPLGQLWLVRDVTDHEEARRGAAEHDRLVAELASLRSDFVATVSHEMRTPLTSIVGLSTLLLETAEDLNPEQAGCVQAIDRSADRLLRLADDLTLLAGLESGGLALRNEPVELARLAADQAAGWQRAADEAGVVLRLDCAHVGPPVRGDARVLARMMDHLLGTAVRVAQRGGTVAASIRPDADAWLIEVTDPNPGAAAPHPLAATFAPPGSAAHASRHSGGLGPTISRAIAGRHHGTITLHTAATGGCTVRVHIPATAQTAE